MAPGGLTVDPGAAEAGVEEAPRGGKSCAVAIFARDWGAEARP